MEQMLEVIARRRLIVGMPFWLANTIATVSEGVRGLTLGLVPAQITRDQVANLRRDNVVAADAKGFAELGITPTSLEAVLPEYLWCYRPSGQYEAITASAKNLKT